MLGQGYNVEPEEFCGQCVPVVIYSLRDGHLVRLICETINHADGRLTGRTLPRLTGPPWAKYAQTTHPDQTIASGRAFALL